MSWGEREKADTDLEFSFWFSVVVLTYLFARFALTDSCQVRNPFSEPTQNKRRNFRLPSHCRVWSSKAAFKSSRPAANKLFSSFLSHIHCPNGDFIWVPSSYQNSQSIRGWYVSIFSSGVPYYFTVREWNMKVTVIQIMSGVLVQSEQPGKDTGATGKFEAELKLYRPQHY